MSGGTDNHLMLVDVGRAGISGAAAEHALHAVDITTNKNLIPYDERPPMEASGIRLGTAALTTRGMGEDEMGRLAGWIADVVAAPEDRRRGEPGARRGRRDRPGPSHLLRVGVPTSSAGIAGRNLAQSLAGLLRGLDFADGRGAGQGRP